MIKPPTYEQYEKAQANLAISFCPKIYPCKKCGWPVVDGYVCGHCGDNNPSTTRTQDAAFNKKYGVKK